MKIGVIADTHISSNNCALPVALINELKKCDLILHAGDVVEMCVLDSLKRVSKLEAVYGNMDSPTLRSQLEEKKILNIEGKKLCLMHGYGNPNNLVEVLKEEFFTQKPDIIVFGHSHVPMNEYIDGVLFFNPGSVTDTVFAPYNSYGIIEIDNKEIKAEIHKL